MCKYNICFFLFACLQDAFIKKFSVKRERTDETELNVSFAFLTKVEMAEDYNMTEPLGCTTGCTTYINDVDSQMWQPRSETQECVDAAMADPQKYIKPLGS